MILITKKQWDDIPSDYKGIWQAEHKNWDSTLPEEYIGKRTVFEGCLPGGTGTALVTEGIHFKIIE